MTPAEQLWRCIENRTGATHSASNGQRNWRPVEPDAVDRWKGRLGIDRVHWKHGETCHIYGHIVFNATPEEKVVTAE
jgi:hypothetical protein